MKYRLAELARRHRIAAPEPPTLQLLDAAERDMIVTGLASVPVVDHQSMLFTPGCFADPDTLPPLLWRHDPQRVVGEIKELNSARDGLHIRAVVRDGEARRAPAFSVGAVILDYEIRNPESATDFHAAILAAEIVEVSMTADPACPGALVRSRFPTSAMVEQHDLVIALIKTAGKIIELARSSGAAFNAARGVGL